ncbi:MAG: metal-sensitive transcriptional regulator [Anaerolineaceae bacterium]|jgi:DNA-binding FrmR family transcriptional regulator
MNLKDDNLKRDLCLRLSRLEGQIHGIGMMLNSERDCEEVLQQLAAVKSATNRVTEIYLQHMLDACISSPEIEGGDAKSVVMNRLVHLILTQ